MSFNAISSWGPDTISLITADASASKGLLDRLTQQAASGRRAESYGGLTRGEAARALSLRPVLTGQQALRDGIDAAQGRMSVAQTALKGISQIASDFRAKISSLNGLSSGQIDSVAASARDALRQVAGLLDSQHNGVYVFAGDDGANPPVPDPDAIAGGAFATAIANAVAGLSANGSTFTISATLAVAGAGGTSPFSASLTGGAAVAAVVPVGEGRVVPVGVLASANGAVASTGASTTGSYTRDILRALATLGSLSSNQANTPGFGELTNDLYTSLGGAVTALNQDAGVLGDRQSALGQTKSTLSDIGTVLKTQLAGAEEVDMASTLSQLTQAQTQLQSSYKIIASLQQLSLTNYL